MLAFGLSRVSLHGLAVKELPYGTKASTEERAPLRTRERPLFAAIGFAALSTLGVAFTASPASAGGLFECRPICSVTPPQCRSPKDPGDGDHDKDDRGKKDDDDHGKKKDCDDHGNKDGDDHGKSKDSDDHGKSGDKDDKGHH